MGREGRGWDGMGWIDALYWICRVAWLVAHHITGINQSDPEANLTHLEIW